MNAAQQTMTDFNQGYMAFGYINESEVKFESSEWLKGYSKAKYDEAKEVNKNEYAS